MKNHPDKNKDYRFRIANREALIGIGLVLFNFIWWFAFAYGLGGKDTSTYTFIFGIPAWFFFSCIIGVAIMAILVWIVVRVFFTEVPFDEELENE
ncbi:YhdT family protein [Sediminibacillus massiliensis]|uniref:YhdT family protein n=1 Tax=Sediminibacillus massiliensis TaxID=1926277 RepID=UPI003CCB9B4D